MSGWTVEDIVKDLEDMADLIAHKKSTDSGSMTVDMEKNFVKGIVGKMEAVSITAKSALVLFHKLESLHSFAAGTKSFLKAIVDKKISDAVTADTRPTTTVTKPQSIIIAYYLTESDWQCLQHHSSYHAKVTCVVQRLRKLGLQSMTEKTAGYGAASILACYRQLPDANTMYQMVLDVKLGFNSIKPVKGLPYLLTYPTHPADLPGEIVAAAYGSGEQAKGFCPDSLPMVFNLISLRGNNKKLSKNKAAAEQKVAVAAPSVLSAPSAGSPQQQVLENLAIVAPALQLLAPFLPHMQVAPPIPGGKREPDQPLAISPKKVKIGTGALAQFKPQLRVPSPAAAKAKAKETAKAKAQEKKTEAKAKAKGKAKAVPKTKANGNADSKPPKPTLCGFTYEPGPPSAEWKGRTKESWSSKHYHTARQLAIKKGYDQDQAKAYARAASQKAVALWNKHM